MNKRDLLYAFENAWLINCVRDGWIDVEETIESWQFNEGCYTRTGEWLSLRTIWNILEDEWAFED